MIEAQETWTVSFGGYGDVIVYQPTGITSVTPNPAITWIASVAEEAGFTGDAAHAGYVTKGDNNELYDQDAIFSAYGRMQPVKEEWIVGKALFAIPLIGFIPLHLFESALIVVIIIVIIELVSRKLKKNKETKAKGKKK